MSKSHPNSALERFQIIRPYLEDDVSLNNLAKKSGFSLSTLKRWVKKYQNNGLKGLERNPRSDKGQRRSVTLELEQLVEAMVLKKPPLSLAAIQRKVAEVAKRRGSPEPTYRVVWLIAQQLDPALIKLAHEGSKEYNQAYELIFRREANLPNEIWQADHTPLDIVLINDKGQAQKPWLTIIIDDYSRAICGYYLSFENPCAINTALALRQAIWKKNSSNWQVCGIPNIFYSDNGSDFKSKHIKQVAADLKIQLINSIPGKPQGRGRIERFFKTVNQLLLMNLPGYSPPKMLYPKPKLTLEEFTPMFEDFIINEYHSRTHSAIGMSPMKRWIGNGFLPQLPDSLEQLDILLLTVVRPRIIHRDGIRFKALRYIDSVMAAYVGEQVMIRYDPRDLAEIRVYHEDRFLCRAICQELTNKKVSLKEIIKARQSRKRELRKIISQRTTLMDTILGPPRPDQSPLIPKEREELQSFQPKAKKRTIKLYKNN